MHLLDPFLMVCAEKRLNGTWVPADEWEEVMAMGSGMNMMWRTTIRGYDHGIDEFVAAHERGVPADASDPVKRHIELRRGYRHSWFLLDELKEMTSRWMMDGQAQLLGLKGAELEAAVALRYLEDGPEELFPNLFQSLDRIRARDPDLGDNFLRIVVWLC